MPALAGAAPWEIKVDVPLADNGRTAQKVELVDVDGDGWVDIVFANSKGEGVSGGAANRELNQLLINDQGVSFTELPGVFEDADNAWVIKAGDVDGDGDADLVVGDTYAGSMSHVLINEGNKAFTREDIPFSANLSIGELELGDVDGDGDLDIMAADWGPLPHGQIDDPGGRLRLWLGNGDGTFTDGTPQINANTEVLAAWSFDLELVDLNNDYALDAMISTRGDADPAVVLLGDGKGDFAVHPVPVLQPMNTKNINVAFTPMDFNGDGFIDVISLQDGGLSQCIGDPPICARRNSVLINDTQEQFTIPMNYWQPLYNPGKIDFDAATLDFNNDGKPDFVTTGLQLAPNNLNSRLFYNDGTQFKSAPGPLEAAFPPIPELSHAVGLMFADFDHDRREDVAVAQRDGSLPNFALFGRDDPMDGVAEDTSPPRIYDDNFGDKLGTLLYFGQPAGFTARVNDHKTPTHWHDYLYDTALASLNLTGDGAGLLAHGRRLPYMEFALGLAKAEDIQGLADDDPKKYIAPSIWFGEALWRVGFTVPYGGKVPDTLTWQYCAIDAANNKACVGPYQVMVDAPDTCGDGMKQEWEECDSNSPTCVMCEETCGDGVCDPNEDCTLCEMDCGACPGESTGPDTGGGSGTATEPTTSTTDNCSCGDGICDPACAETFESCSQDCTCGNGMLDPGETCETCPVDCDGTTTTDGMCPDSAGAGDGQCQLDDDGCGCVTDTQGSRGLWASLLLLGVFGVRRSRKHA